MIFRSNLKFKKAKVFEQFLLPFFCVLLFAVFSISVFSQNSTEFFILSEKIRNGTDEEKRDILHKIRNIRTEQASRLAIPALNDSSEIVRATAVGSIIFLPKNEAAQFLIPHLQDKSPFVRRETAYALGKVKNSLAVNSLLTVLQKDKQIEVKNAAVIAFGEIGDVSTVENLIKILQRKPKNSEEFLRRSAARSIGQIAQKQNLIREIKDIYKNESIENPPKPFEKFPIFKVANEVLINVLQNPKEAADTRREAAFALGEIRNPESIQALKAKLSAEDYYLAEIVEKSLNRIQ